jgi:hypothetical protein
MKIPAIPGRDPDARIIRIVAWRIDFSGDGIGPAEFIAATTLGYGLAIGDDAG